MKCWIWIPARLASERLTRKMLLPYQGIPLIVHTLRSAQASNIGPVRVACCSQELADVIIAHGGEAVVTPSELPSGTDRIFHGLTSSTDSLQPEDIVINLQGDLPVFPPLLLRELFQHLIQHPSVDIATPIALLDREERLNPNRVKVVWSPFRQSNKGRAHYFSRAPIPYQSDFYFEHVGIYAYRYPALRAFTAHPTTPLEIMERLEQLRALDMGMKIGVILLDEAPLSIDTHDDYTKLIER